MHRGLLDLRFVVVGVLVPDVAAEVDAESDGVVVMSDDSGSWLLRGEGVKRLSVDESVNCKSPTVVAGSSCFPARTSLEPAGRVVEAERNSRRLATVCDVLTLRLILLPPLVFTTTCRVSE